MHSLITDLRYGFRQLRRAPGFAIAAALTLALGIGANTAMFSLLDQALLRSLPVRNPQELVVLRGTGKVWEGSTNNWGGGVEAYFSYPMYRDLRDRDGAFRSLLAMVPAQVNFVHDGGAQILNVELVSGNYFNVLGVLPATGRLLTQGDDTQPGANPVAVMSYEFWRHEMGGSPSAVGSTVSLNGHPFQVIGVAADGFQSAAWGKTPGLFIPLSMTGIVMPGAADRLTDRHNRWINLIGRLQPHETVAQASAQSAPLWHALRAEELKTLGTRSQYFTDEFLTRSRLLVQPAAQGFSYSRDIYRAPLTAVMGMAALVLLIAVVNVGSLLLVRSAGRVREFSMRHALGASTTRIVEQLLAEGLLLGVAGGLLGVLLAPVAVHAVASRLIDDSGSAIFSTAINARVLAFNFAVALGTSLLFSLAPALQLRRRHLSLALRQTTGTSTRSMLLMRRIIVGLQIGLSLLLLVGAGLFVRTVHRLRSEAVGFRTDHLLSFSVSPSLVGYTAPQLPSLRRQLTDALTSIPGVQRVAITTDPELAGSSSYSNFSFQNYTQPPDQKLDIELGWISAGYFATLKAPLVAGRDFTAMDDAGHPAVAIVNEMLARRLFRSPERAIGQRLMRGASDHPVFNTEIVGVVQDMRHEDLRTTPSPSLFEPLAQMSNPDYDLFFYLRSATDPTTLLHSVRERIASVDGNLAVQQLRTMDEQIDTSMQNERLIALLATAFGALAAVLAGVGLYGVLAFVTAQRTREIGVRMALGASRGSVSQLVLKDVLKLTLSGMIVAVPVAILLGRLVRSQLYGVSPTDPVSLIAAVLLLAAVALVASALPARRAASVNPTEALRTE